VKRPGCIEAQVLLHERTTLRVGGPARWLAQPADSKEVVNALQWTDAEGISWTALGAGSNILFGDNGYPGLVLATSELRGFELSGECVTASAGEPLAHIARLACEAGLSGLEWAWGIPGTVGGALAMNAGTREGTTADVLDQAVSAGAEGLHRHMAGSLGFGYRTSRFLTGELNEVATGVTFALVRSTPSRAIEAAKRMLDERRRTQPTGATAGCTFKNPPSGPSAGELLDRAGCKGLRVGQAYVTTQHANFILNDGSENATDVLELIDEMKRRVKDRFGVELVEELVLL